MSICFQETSTCQISLQNKFEKSTTGITETTKERKAYVYLQNPKITFWDLPGTGTEEFSDLEKYPKEVDLDSYHLFLILTATRFTFNDLKLARKIKSISIDW